MSSDPKQQPLVSVGIPCYNRIDGLRATLRCITRQTHRNLEIIVSDNCSPTTEIETLVRDGMKSDPRIRYFKQGKNIGIVPNYQFVLRQAKGEFFMWAADDDEWDERFVEVCLDNIGDRATFMTGYRFLNRYYGEYFPSTSINIPPSQTKAETLWLFFNHYFVHVLYGLHRRSAIQFMLEDESFDNYDTYFVLRMILEHGIVIKDDEKLFTATMDTPHYEPKCMAPSDHKLRSYFGCFGKLGWLIATSSDLKLWQKLRFLKDWLFAVLVSFSATERERCPFAASLVMMFLRIASLPQRIGRLLLPGR
jgi:glycosyltransferase involved in cell wall biosynthesis